MSDDRQAIGRGTAEQSVADAAQPPGDPRPRPSAVAAATIRRLLDFPSEAALDAALNASALFRNPDFAALLVDRGRRLAERGDSRGSEELRRLATQVTGTDEAGMLEAVAVVVRFARIVLHGDGPDPSAAHRQTLAALAPATAQAAQHLLTAESAGHLQPTFASRLWELLATTTARTAEQLGPRPWLELAISALARAVALCVTDDPRLPILLNDLSIRLSQLDRAVPGSSLLAGAAVTAQRVVDLTPSGDPRLATRLMNLSNRLHDVYCATGDPQCLDAALATAERALAAAPGDLDELPLLRENFHSLLEAKRQGVGIVVKEACDSETPGNLPSTPN